MSEIPVPQEGPPAGLIYNFPVTFEKLVTFLGGTIPAIGGGNILTINGDATPAQSIIAGTGITVTDNGVGGHTIATTAPLAPLLSINGDTTQAQGLSASMPVLIADDFVGGHNFGFLSAFGISRSVNPERIIPPVLPAEFPLVLDGSISFRKFDNTVANGVNNNIVIGLNPDGYFSAHLKLSGATGFYSITGFAYPYTDAPTLRSCILIVELTDAQLMNFVNLNAGSAGPNQIDLDGNGAYAVQGPATVAFYYEITSAKWKLLARPQSVNGIFPLTFVDLGGGNLNGSVATFTALGGGIVPPSGGGTTNFLRADATWNPPPANVPTVQIGADPGGVSVVRTAYTSVANVTISKTGVAVILGCVSIQNVSDYIHVRININGTPQTPNNTFGGTSNAPEPTRSSGFAFFMGNVTIGDTVNLEAMLGVNVSEPSFANPNALQVIVF